MLSHRGEHAAAESLAAEASKTLEPTDYLELRADLLVHQAHVLREAGKPEEALSLVREASRLYERKGATFLVAQTRALTDAWAV